MGYFKAPSADIIGNVQIGDASGVWYHSTLRGDCEPIVIGNRTNLQDNCVVHPGPGFPVTVGDDVTVGHSAIVHGCTIGNSTLIGMGSIVMNGAVVGNHCIVAAGSLVTQGMQIPDGMMVMGSPAKIKRPLTEDEIKGLAESAKEYVQLATELLQQIPAERE